MGSHAHHDMHPNSTDAYRVIMHKLTGRRQMVYCYLHMNGPRTDREIMAGLGFHDTNSVRPRITELVTEGLLVETGSRKDVTTDRTVRVVDVVRAEKQQRLL